MPMPQQRKRSLEDPGFFSIKMPRPSEKSVFQRTFVIQYDFQSRRSVLLRIPMGVKWLIERVNACTKLLEKHREYRFDCIDEGESSVDRLRNEIFAQC
jgi:hypothetical protein